jgi:outer membrane protein assembly factor BamB
MSLQNAPDFDTMERGVDMAALLNVINRLFCLFFSASLLFTGGVNRAFNGDVYPFESETSVIYFESLLRAQGVTTDGESWIFSGRNALERVSLDGKTVLAVNAQAIPDALKERYGSAHVGGISFADGLIWAPIEDSKTWAHPIVATFDAKTLAFTGDYWELPVGNHGHGVPWVAADAGNGLLYAGDGGNDREIFIYDLGDLSERGKLALAEPVEDIQGGEVYEGLLYLGSNDRTRAVYTVDPATGEVTKLFDRIAYQPKAIDNFGGEGEDLTLLLLPDSTVIHTLQTGASFLDLRLRHYKLPE